MKRSSCLSALVTSLSLTAAATALAAPPKAATDAPATKVALAQPTDAAQDAPGTGTAPTTAPAAGNGAGQTAQPAITVGTGNTTPGTDTPAEAAPEEQKRPKPRPFAGSSLYVQNSMTTGTVFRGQQQDWNPTIESSFWLLPRYALNDAFQLRGRLIVNYEFTDSDSTTYRGEPQLSDTTLSLFYRKIPPLPLGIQAALAFNAGLPTSKMSRARTNVFTPGGTLQLVKPIEHIFGGEGMLMGSVIYSHPVYTSRNAEVVDPRPPGAFSCMGGNTCQDLLTGSMNPSDSLVYALLFVLEWGHWSPALYYLGGSQWVYTPKEVRNPVDGTPIGRPDGFEPTSVRQTHYFSAWLDYNFNSWITGEIGFWNSTSVLAASGRYSNPFFNQYADTRVYLGASIQLDNLVKEIQGGDQGEAGIVRAKNNKQPMWTF
jgi:hypothetical protein